MRLRVVCSLVCGSLVLLSTGASTRNGNHNKDSRFLPSNSWAAPPAESKILDRTRIPSNNHNNKHTSTLSSSSSLVLSKRAFVANTAFWTGVADVICFRLNGCYANMMTGNTVRVATALGELRVGQALFYAALCLSYAVGHGVYRGLVLQLQQKPSSLSSSSTHNHHQHHLPEHTMARSRAMALMVALLGLSDYMFLSNTQQSPLVVWRLHILPLAVGFGLWNAACSEALGGAITFAMTGHVHKISHGMVDYLCHTRKWRSATKQSVRILGYFFVGVLVATACVTLSSAVPLLETLVNHYLQRVPPFTALGLLLAGLLQWYDQPWEARTSKAAASNKILPPPMDVSVDKWRQPDIWFSNTVDR